MVQRRSITTADARSRRSLTDSDVALMHQLGALERKKFYQIPLKSKGQKHHEQQITGRLQHRGGGLRRRI